MPSPPALFLRRQTTMRCPMCGYSRALAAFRRWAHSAKGNKRVLHEVCNYCAPAKTVAEMTDAQRAAAVAAGRAAPALVTLVTLAETQQANNRRSASIVKVTKAKRLLAWKESVLQPLRDERKWAQTSARSSRRRRLYPWAAFFEAYAQALDDACRRATERAAAKYGPLAPAPGENSPQQWLYPETRHTLRRLYADCAKAMPTRGRLFKDPAFIGEDDADA